MKQKLHLLKSFQVFDRRCTKTESANHRPGSLVLRCAVRDAAAKVCFTCKQCMYVCSPPTNRLDYCRQCRYASPRYNMKHFDIQTWTTAAELARPFCDEVTAVQQLSQVFVTDTAVLRLFHGLLTIRLLQQCQQFLRTYRQQIGLEAVFGRLELACMQKVRINLCSQH